MYLRLTPVCFFSACAKMSSTISRGTLSARRVPLAAAVAAAARTAARAMLEAAIAAAAGMAAMGDAHWGVLLPRRAPICCC
jgi:hypothetical protein